MKIFISWSGERSEALAKALRDWMQLVLHFAQPWLSQSDIKAGDRWNVEIAKELENCNFGDSALNLRYYLVITYT